MSRQDPPGSWHDLVAQVRRYDQHALLGVLATLSAERAGDHIGGWAPVPPFAWTITGVARIALLAGTTRRLRPTPDDAKMLCSHLFNLPPENPEGSDPEVWMSALAAPQIALQTYMPHEMARSWLVYAADEFGDPLDAPSSLACSLDEALRASFVLMVWAQRNHGRVDLELLDTPHMKAVIAKATSRDAMEATTRALTTSVTDARALAGYTPRPGVAPSRHGLDPLAQRPLIHVDSGPLLAPAIHQIPRALTTNDLYYRLKDEQGQGLANDLGRRFEKYIGRLLEEATFGEPKPERKFRRNNLKVDSIDWLFVMTDRVVLVECKATRLKNAALMSPEAEQSSWDATIGKALGQIAATDAAISPQRSAFSDIPSDLPRFGLVVTLEDLLFSVRRGRERDAAIPSRVSTPRDIEVFTMLEEAQAQAVLDNLYLNDLTLHDALGAVIGGTEVPMHPLLEDAWARVSPSI